ncbi:MAG: hypothetical protein Q8Q59_15920 [Luteolibacter sp.]|nr:hypothetical protein [Luteolibacter sp.]
MDTQCDLILQALTEANGEWVPMPRLAELSGSYNIHSRVNELRKDFGYTIENKLTRDPKNRRRKNSFYRIPGSGELNLGL